MELEMAPAAVLIFTVLEKPVLLMARPVVGLKSFPPALKVIRTLVAAVARPSVEATRSLAMIRSRVALISTAAVLLIWTDWVAANVSRVCAPV